MPRQTLEDASREFNEAARHLTLFVAYAWGIPQFMRWLGKIRFVKRISR
jgi:hypothetical protein